MALACLASQSCTELGPAHPQLVFIKFYRVGCSSTRLDLRNVVLSNEHKQKIVERCTLRKRSIIGLLVCFSEKLV